MSTPDDSADDLPSDSLSISTGASEGEAKKDQETQEIQDVLQGLQEAQEGQGDQGQGGYFASAVDWAGHHPIRTVAFGAVPVVAAAPFLVATPVLGLLGFGSSGIVSGSIAAGAQSGIGSVLAPSLFATLQSAGAGGYGLAAVHGVVQGAVVGAGGIGAWFSRPGAKKEGGGRDEGIETAASSADNGGPNSDGPQSEKSGSDEEAPGEGRPGDDGPKGEAARAEDIRSPEAKPHL